MAVTGTNIFTVTRDDIIKAALRVCKVIGIGETPQTEDYLNCSQALNIMIKSWSNNNKPLWVFQDIILPTVTDVGSYELGPTAGVNGLVMSRPLDIPRAFIRDSAGQDSILTPISMTEYHDFGLKTAQGTPNQYYYDRQEPNGIIHFLNVPTDASSSVHLKVVRQFYDMTTGTDNFDFPEEFFLALKWGLADEIALEYDVSAQDRQEIGMKASAYITDAFDGSEESVSVYFTVNTQG